MRPAFCRPSRCVGRSISRAATLAGWILSGDTRQHHSVERGDALRVLERVGAVSQVVLTKIFRQLDPAQRAAIYDLSEGETAHGFDKLKDLGAIVEISDPFDGCKS